MGTRNFNLKPTPDSDAAEETPVMEEETTQPTPVTPIVPATVVPKAPIEPYTAGTAMQNRPVPVSTHISHPQQPQTLKPTFGMPAPQSDLRAKIDIKTYEKVAEMDARFQTFEKELDHCSENVTRMWEYTQALLMQSKAQQSRTICLNWRTQLLEFIILKQNGMQVQPEILEQTKVEMIKFQQEADIFQRQADIAFSKVAESTTPPKKETDFGGLLGFPH